jgi:hypothetical protein
MLDFMTFSPEVIWSGVGSPLSLRSAQGLEKRGNVLQDFFVLQAELIPETGVTAAK